jgi:hypothetical protein
MPRKRKLSPEDIELFRREVGPVNPVPSTNRADIGNKPRKPAASPSRDADPIQERIEFLDTFEPKETEAGDELSFIRSGVQYALFRKLRKGRYAVRGELDLHGMTTAQARRELVCEAGVAYALFTAKAITPPTAGPSLRVSSILGCDSATKCWRSVRRRLPMAVPAPSMFCSAAADPYSLIHRGV